MQLIRTIVAIALCSAVSIKANPAPLKSLDHFTKKNCRSMDCSIAVQTLPFASNLDKIFNKTLQEAHDSPLASISTKEKTKDWIMKTVGGALGANGLDPGNLLGIFNVGFNLLQPLLEVKNERKIWLMNGFVWQGETKWLPPGIPPIENSITFRGTIKIDRATVWIPQGQGALLGDMSVDGPESPAVAWIDNCQERQRVVCVKHKF